MKVLKFGGTSVGSSENIHKVVNIIAKASQTTKLAVIVSAVGGITDQLLKAAQLACLKDKTYQNVLADITSKHSQIVKDLFHNNEVLHLAVSKVVSKELSELKRLLDGIFLIEEVSPKTKDKLMSFGEIIASRIIYNALNKKGLNTELKNSQELIITDSNFTHANVDFELTNLNIQLYFNSNVADITVLPGFVAKSVTNDETTLGRGGSDYTAALIAAAIDASELQIWTDVSGMYTANPKLVKQASPIESLSYQEAIELSHFGAKVLYPPTVMPVLNKHIPIVIKNTLKPEATGTRISEVQYGKSQSPVKGLSNIDHLALLTLQGNGMIGVPGYSKRLFEALAQEKINVIFITQSSSEHSICFGIAETDANKAKREIDSVFEYEIAAKRLDPVIVETELSIIALVGDCMKSHQGISGKMFSALGKNNVNIRAIAQGASERNISAVIHKDNVKKALNVLHEHFFEVKTKQINLFITGVGNVGERLIDQVKQQQKYVKEHFKINLRVIGLSNSRKMLFTSNGIDLEHWKTLLSHGEPASLSDFLDQTKNLNLRNSVFVDITANADVAQMYGQYLKQSISVVACNKIACSSDFESYYQLKQLAKTYNASFLFETNVGAGLPVIDTLRHLITSGDEINSIKAVLSGSLNFVFNNFNADTTFYDIVKEAQEEGYTEPDPRIDLSGVDVARKILILARESGYPLELGAIESDNFLTEKAMSAQSVDAFFETLKEDEAHYQSLYASAQAHNSQLKFVAEFNEGRASVGLKEIPDGHPFYNLEGKDNIVMFYTKRYSEQPLIIKGAGAGAEVTASGLFADIIRIANY